MKRVYVAINGLGEDDENLGGEKPVVNHKDETASPPQEEKISLTISEIEALIDKRVKESESKGNTKDLLLGIEKILKSRPQNSEDGRTVDFSPVRQEDIDPDDFLEVPDVFFAHCVSTTIWDDRKFGRSIRPPYGPIYFRAAVRTVDTTNNKIPQYTSISVVYIYSKAQSEFIRNHSLFQIKYFEKIGDQKVVSKDEADALLRANNIVSGLSEHQIRQRCVAAGVKITTADSSQLKQMLIKRLAEDIKEADLIQKTKRLEELNETFVIGESQESSSKIRTERILS